MPGTAVMIFAKSPEPGAVKTRMTPPLTQRDAADLHIASLLAVCERVSSWARARDDGAEVRPILVATPDDRLDEFRTLLADRVVDYWAQGNGDLGARLTRACDRAFDQGARRVILLGADSPTLPAALLDEGVARLADHDSVLGPCDDGGYYLLALQRPLPALFERIDWGGEHVADQTRRRAQSAGITLHELDPWYDLDRFDDLRLAANDLAAVNEPHMPAAAALRAWINSRLEQHQP